MTDPSPLTDLYQDDTTGISHHSYIGIPALAGMAIAYIILLVAFVVSSLSPPVLHAHLLSIIQMVSSLVSSSHLFSTMLCRLSLVSYLDYHSRSSPACSLVL
jgi:hypothetical protein